MAQFNSISIKRAPQQNFYDINRGLEVKVLPTQPASENSGYTYHMSGKSFYLAPTVQYVRSMGLTEMNPNTDYRLYIKINQADVDGFKGGANVVLEVSLENEKGKEVFTQKNISGSGKALTTFVILASTKPIPRLSSKSIGIASHLFFALSNYPKTNLTSKFKV